VNPPYQGKIVGWVRDRPDVAALRTEPVIMGLISG
jgi:hypothetical protein